MVYQNRAPCFRSLKWGDVKLVSGAGIVDCVIGERGGGPLDGYVRLTEFTWDDAIADRARNTNIVPILAGGDDEEPSE